MWKTGSSLQLSLLAIALCSSTVAQTPGLPTLNHEQPVIEALDLDRVGSGPRPWTSLQALDADAQFHFIVVTDRTGGHRDGIWADAMSKINLLQPAFVTSVGDLIEGYTEDRAELLSQWEELDAMVDELEPPFFYAPGNHDYSNQVMADLWEERLGDSYYSFEYKDTLFIILNSSLFNITETNADNEVVRDWSQEQHDQLSWLRQTLADNSDVRWTYLFMHHPYWRETWWRRADLLDWTDVGGPDVGDTGADQWRLIAAQLEARDYTAFAGHTHNYEYEIDSDGAHTHERISLATTGGGSTLGSGDVLAGPEYAEFDHFVWVTMTPDGPVIANLLLDGILPKDFDHFFKRPAQNAAPTDN